jgi:Fic family protein
VPYIHEHRDWPHFRWDDRVLSPLLAEVRHRQGLLLGRMEHLGFHLRTEANLGNLSTEIVQSGLIEGERLDAKQVRSSIARRLGLPEGGVEPASREIEGVVDILLDATRQHTKALTAARLFGWHASLFPSGWSGLRRITVGNWRPPTSDPMQVVSGPLGRERVHFEAPGAARLPEEMQTFLEWFARPPALDPVLIAGIAHFLFVTVHPFEDGNGRLARTITDLALARAEGRAERFYSMSAQIGAERNAYYDQLESSQRGEPDLTDWLSWFLACFGRALSRAEGTLSSVLQKARRWEKFNQEPLNPRQRMVLNRLLDGFQGNLTSSKYAKLAKCSTDSALRDLKHLVEKGILRQGEAGGRSTTYSLP